MAQEDLQLRPLSEAQRPEGKIVYYYDDDGSAALGASTRKLYKVEQYASDNTTVTYTETTAFDRLGRTVSVTTNRQGEITTTSTTYDELGRVKTETDAGGLTVRHVYDSRSFETELRDYYTGEVYYKPLTFDAAGRVLTEELGEGITTTNTWREETGALLTTTSEADGITEPLQDLEMDWDAVGNLQFREDFVRETKETFGYDDAYRLTSTGFETASTFSTTSYTYTSDNTGNIHKMPNVGGTLATYSYDATATHRLTSVSGTGLDRQYVYNANGEITHEYEGAPSSGDIRRNYVWSSFHKPTQIIHNHDYAYTLKDPDGNVVRAGGLVTMTFDYGPGDSRIKQHVVTDEYEKQTHYYGSYERLETYEVLTGGGIALEDIKHRHSIGGVAMKEIIEDASGNRGPPETKYYLRDHLGSVTATLTYNGAIWTASSNASYDAWGRPRQEEKWEPADTGVWITNPETTRGFTGHEMLDDVGLVHMNGRIYDAELGRFLTPDPFVQAPENAQNYNRYSYVLNNPVSYTDPSGYFISAIVGFLIGVLAATTDIINVIVKAIKRAARWVKENWRVVASIAFTFVMAWAFVGIAGGSAGLAGSSLGGLTGGYLGAAVAGAASGAFNAAINGGDLGDILKGAVIGGITGAVTHGLSLFAGPKGLDIAGAFRSANDAMGYTKVLVHSAAHGVVGGLRNVAMGGKFKDGFLSAAISSAASHVMEYSGANGALGLGSAGDRDPLGVAKRTTVAAAVGGTVSSLSGGDFANGAYTAAFQHLLNHESFDQAQRWALKHPMSAETKARILEDLWAMDKEELGSHLYSINYAWTTMGQHYQAMLDAGPANGGISRTTYEIVWANMWQQLQMAKAVYGARWGSPEGHISLGLSGGGVLGANVGIATNGSRWILYRGAGLTTPGISPTFSISGAPLPDANTFTGQFTATFIFGWGIDPDGYQSFQAARPGMSFMINHNKEL